MPFGFGGNTGLKSGVKSGQKTGGVLGGMSYKPAGGLVSNNFGSGFGFSPAAQDAASNVKTQPGGPQPGGPANAPAQQPMHSPQVNQGTSPEQGSETHTPQTPAAPQTPVAAAADIVTQTDTPALAANSSDASSVNSPPAWPFTFNPTAQDQDVLSGPGGLTYSPTNQGDIYSAQPQATAQGAGTGGNPLHPEVNAPPVTPHAGTQVPGPAGFQQSGVGGGLLGTLNRARAGNNGVLPTPGNDPGMWFNNEIVPGAYPGGYAPPNRTPTGPPAGPPAGANDGANAPPAAPVTSPQDRPMTGRGLQGPRPSGAAPVPVTSPLDRAMANRPIAAAPSPPVTQGRSLPPADLGEAILREMTGRKIAKPGRGVPDIKGFAR